MIVARNIKNIIQQNIYKSKGSNLLENGFPKIWDLDFIKIHNCVIFMKLLKNGQEDYNCWLRVLEITKCAYVDMMVIMDMGKIIKIYIS